MEISYTFCVLFTSPAQAEKDEEMFDLHDQEDEDAEDYKMLAAHERSLSLYRYIFFHLKEIHPTATIVPRPLHCWLNCK